MSSNQETVRNFSRAAQQVGAYGDAMDPPFMKSLRMVAEEIMTDAKTSLPGRGVPRETGILAASGAVDGPIGNLVLLSFGGVASAYAMKQHEDMTLRHPLGEPRYLVRAVERWQPDGSAAMDALKEQARQLATRTKAPSTGAR